MTDIGSWTGLAPVLTRETPQLPQASGGPGYQLTGQSPMCQIPFRLQAGAHFPDFSSIPADYTLLSTSGPLCGHVVRRFVWHAKHSVNGGCYYFWYCYCLVISSGGRHHLTSLPLVCAAPVDPRWGKPKTSSLELLRAPRTPSGDEGRNGWAWRPCMPLLPEDLGCY